MERTGLKATIAIAIALFALVVVKPVFADETINPGQWYTAQFGEDVPSAVFGGNTSIGVGTNGPLPGGGSEDAIATSTDVSVWDVTLGSAGYLVVTDAEESGDKFEVLVNGSPATVIPDTYLDPAGQMGLAGGLTSDPWRGEYMGTDIGDALSDANFSSGTFYLPAGTDTISFVYEGSVGNGDMDFFADEGVTPEPNPLVLMLTGFAAIGLLAAWKRRGAPAVGF